MSVGPSIAIDTLAAAAPPGQQARLQALHAYGILDTPIEAAFEDITLIASQVCGTPIAVVNLIDEGRQWFKSERGLGVRETPLETSICAHAILENDFLEVPDTREDPRFACNPLVTGEAGLRFYAGALLRTPEGHALGTVCVLDYQPRTLDQGQRDVLFALARQTMAQLELRRAMAESRRSLNSHRRIMAVAGHDLRNPLSLIDLALHHVATLASLEPLEREQLELASQASRELADTLRRLAEASEIEERIELLPLQLGDFMLGVVERWRYVAQRAGRSLEAEIMDAPLLGNPLMLRTIIDNLVSNALKHGQSGPVTIRTWRDAGGIWIGVEDMGPGIPIEHQDRIFEAFHQIGVRRDGLGLGLSIVQRTAELLGARVHLDSPPGGGTRFNVQFPNG